MAVADDAMPVAHRQCESMPALQTGPFGVGIPGAAEGGHQVWSDEGPAGDGPIAHQEAGDASHVGGGRYELGRGTRIHGNGRIRDAVFEMAHGQARIGMGAGLGGESEAAVMHAERAQEFGVQPGFVAAPRDRLDEHAEQMVAGARVDVARAGARMDRQAVASKGLVERCIGLRAQAEHLIKAEVFETRSMRE